MNERQQKLGDILEEISSLEEANVIQYYGILLTSYSDEIIDKYAVRLDNIYDKIFLAQWCNNLKKVNELVGEVHLSDYQKQKYEKLRRSNIDLNETINFRILDEKYAFLDGILDMIVADRDTQDQILSLSSERLELFKLMCYRLNELTDYPIPYINSILQRIGYVTQKGSYKNQNHRYDDLLIDIDKIFQNGGFLSDKEIDTMLYLCTSTVRHTVPSYVEMKNFGNDNTIDQQEFKELLEEGRKTKDIDILKFLLLVQAYGMHLGMARKICDKYNIQDLEVTNENKDLFEMYRAIFSIVYEKDADVLLQLYDEFRSVMKPELDFRRVVVFENEMRAAFAHDLGERVFKTEGRDYQEIAGVKIYDAGLDFKIIVTAIGAYNSDFTNQDNYSNYWNSPSIRSHGNCCSLIGNSNLSMAPVKNIILGFSCMNDNMLLLSGSSDINSTPNSRDFDLTQYGSQRFMGANNMLDETRGDYNELVYERRDLSSNPIFYKKNPDYIVFIEEYEDFARVLEAYKDNPRSVEYLKKQKEEQDMRWQETMKAAKDFNIPIVKINRERVARNEYAVIINLIEQFKMTKNADLLSKIITRFENNRVGNCGRHAPIKDRFFSQKQMSAILADIKQIISNEENERIRNSLYFALYKAILMEQQKVKACNRRRNNNQIPGLDFERELTSLEQLFRLENKDLIDDIGGRK